MSPGCASMVDDPKFKGPRPSPKAGDLVGPGTTPTSTPSKLTDPASHAKASVNMSPSGMEKSIQKLMKEKEFLRGELISVWNTIAEAERIRTEDQDAFQKTLATLQQQIDEFQVAVQAQDKAVKRAARALQDLDHSVTQQGKILQEFGRRSAHVAPDPAPIPSAAVTSPKTPKRVVSEGSLPSVLPTVDLNTASAAVLVRGLSLTRPDAEEIIKHRPYKRIGELVSMNVIPKATFDRIRKQLVISAPAEQ